MSWGKPILVVAMVGLMLPITMGCERVTESVEQTSSASEQITRPEGWTDETHGSNADPNYEIVFLQNKVNQIKITIEPDDWEVMQADMAKSYGAQGTKQPGVGGLQQDRGGRFPGDAGQDGAITPDAGVPGWADMTPENPVWVPATIEFNNLTWMNVGVRYKGNSSLTSGWRSGTLELPLKLDFDEFEDEYPEIDNQRFYGFKQLSLSNSFKDSTYMRDTIAADILAEAGLVAAETAYYEVILDYGEGPVNLGLYVMVEVVDDTVIETYFGDDSGNIYEADGRGASLAQGSLGQIESSFLKENNIQEADWSDIEELYNVLHSDSRMSDAEEWRESLESIFDVDVFLEWLAISAIIQHWDTYGAMSHNFYLYHDPDTGLLTWISWDHNEVLEVGGGVGRQGVSRRSVSLDRDEIGQDWPLIRYLLDDPVYYERYINYIEETINGVFNPDTIAERCQALAELIAPYVGQGSSATAFESAVQELIDRVYERFEVASTFLADEGR
jgi:spore coat protein H